MTWNVSKGACQNVIEVIEVVGVIEVIEVREVIEVVASIPRAIEIHMIHRNPSLAMPRHKHRPTRSAISTSPLDPAAWLGAARLGAARLG